jgi:hypothetical protein
VSSLAAKGLYLSLRRLLRLSVALPLDGVETPQAAEAPAETNAEIEIKTVPAKRTRSPAEVLLDAGDLLVTERNEFRDAEG